MIDYLAPLVVSWWFVNFEPIHYILDRVFLRIEADWLHTALGCWKCMSFWTTWIYSGSFIIACATSLTAVCLNKLIYNS
jgi:hypothetical protein